jgi:2-polyprenyl-6-methoxyphenol hydroxylase-like FAD-dependent oxidoreductase
MSNSEAHSRGSPAERRRRGRAVVIGGSTTGLLAARILSDFFTEVTLIEKDSFPCGAEARKGAPQMRHVHVLLKRGERIFDRFLPNLLAELRADGGHAIDMAADTRWFHFGGWRKRFESGMTFLCQSRPFLEWKIREEVSKVPGVALLDETEVRGLRTSADGRAITGVAIRRKSEEKDEDLAADLVVDASGRGSRMPQWLRAAGYPEVPESKVTADVGYASRYYHVPADPSRDWKALFVYPRAPGKRLSVVVPVEGDRWMVTHYPPGDPEGFLAFAKSLPAPDVYRELLRAEPCSPIATHKFPGNVWRRYDRMARVPEGLAVIGDALCSFNPIYGQGMTLGAIAAETLHECLEARFRAGEPGVVGFADRFRETVARAMNRVWLQTTTADLRYDQTKGERSWWVAPLNGYAARIYELGWSDEDAATAFLEVMHHMEAPTRLFRPALVWKVVRTLLPGTSRPVVEAEPADEVADRRAA